MAHSKLFLLLIGALLLTTSIPAHAQTSKLYLSAHFSLDAAYRVLNNRTGSYYVDQDILDDNRNTTAKFGSCFGIGATYRFSEKIGIRSGFGFLFTGSRSTKQPGGNGFYRYTYNFSYFSIPLHLDIVLGSGRTRFFMAPGFSFDVRTGSALMERYYSSTGILLDVEKNIILNAVSCNISPSIELGVQHAFTDKIMLRVAPHFQIQSISAIRYEYVGTRFFNVGLNFTFLYGVL